MLFRILAKFYFKWYMNLNKNLCATCPSFVKTAHCALTDSKRVHVIDSTIFLLCDFLQIAFCQFNGHMPKSRSFKLKVWLRGQYYVSVIKFDRYTHILMLNKCIRFHCSMINSPWKHFLTFYNEGPDTNWLQWKGEHIYIFLE